MCQTKTAGSGRGSLRPSLRGIDAPADKFKITATFNLLPPSFYHPRGHCILDGIILFLTQSTETH